MRLHFILGAVSICSLRPTEVLLGDAVGSSVSLTIGTPAADSVAISTSLALTRKGRCQQGGSLFRCTEDEQWATIRFLWSEW